jgi:hypothetical protein
MRGNITARRELCIELRGYIFSASARRLFPRYASDVVQEDMVSEIHPRGNGSVTHALRVTNSLGN